jgi:hypothetical protein
VWAKSQVELAAGNPRYQAATKACGYLLPDGGPGVPPSQAVVQQIQNDMLKFVRCMRSHGVPDWPDPTLDRGRAIFDPQAVGIDPNSPQISTKIHECSTCSPRVWGFRQARRGFAPPLMGDWRAAALRGSSTDRDTGVALLCREGRATGARFRVGLPELQRNTPGPHAFNVAMNSGFKHRLRT